MIAMQQGVTVGWQHLFIVLTESLNTQKYFESRNLKEKKSPMHIIKEYPVLSSIVEFLQGN